MRVACEFCIQIDSQKNPDKQQSMNRAFVAVIVVAVLVVVAGGIAVGIYFAVRDDDGDGGDDDVTTANPGEPKPSKHETLSYCWLNAGPAS